MEFRVWIRVLMNQTLLACLGVTGLPERAK